MLVRPRYWAARTFRSLQVANYRRYFLGHTVSVCGTWMQRVGQDWLVLELSDSGVALGVATALQFAPVLLGGLWGGVVVDRVRRRRLLVATQTSSAVLAAILAALTLTDVVTLWMVYVLAFALGVVTVFDNPGRQTFLTELVAREDLLNAQALASTAHNAGRLIGPAIAGVLIATVGVGYTFLVNAASFVAVIVSLLIIDRSSLRPATLVPQAPGQAREGLRYVWRHPELRAGIILVAVVGVFGQNFRVVLPLLAQDSLHGGPQTYGYLTAALGLGAVLGALGSAARERSSGRALLLACVAFGVINLLVALSPTVAVALVGMVGLGVGNIVLNTLARTLMLVTGAPGVQGRIMALHALVFLGSTPVGGPLVGWICSTWGARSGLVVGGVAALVSAAAVVPSLRRCEQDRLSRRLA
jgi:MFS family permease